MLGKAMPKHTSGMCTANDSACICRASSRWSCSTGGSAAPRTCMASSWAITRSVPDARMRGHQGGERQGREPDDVEVEPVARAELDGDQDRRCERGELAEVALARPHRDQERERQGGDLHQRLEPLEAGVEAPERKG